MVYKFIVTTLEGIEIANYEYKTKDEYEQALASWTKREGNPIDKLPLSVSALVITVYQQVNKYEPIYTTTMMR
jgi:hypothetical protein